VPLVNPDGWVRVEAGAEWWRKNTDGASGSCGANPGFPSNSSTPGVDLNRNHGFRWNAGGGASDNPCAETYQGPAAVSEPETQAVQALVDAVRPTVLISWHAYGNQVLWPWGYSTSAGSADPVLDALGGRLAALAGYQGGPGGALLYATTGELTDWAWATRGVAAFTVEVGSLSDGIGGNPFAPPYANLERYWRENKPAALYLARVADATARAYGPDPGVPSVSAPPGAVAASVSVSLTTGAATPAAAELFLDTPGPEGSGQAGAVSFDGRSATWSLPSALVPPGRHGVWVRARDAAGRWGPLNAVSGLFGRYLLLFPTGAQRGATVP
jgi:hypothetical protein